MARTKGAKNRKKHVFQDPTIEEIVEMEVEVKDPKTGKMIKQIVKVKRLKALKREEKVFVGATSIIDDLEKEEQELAGNEPDTEE